MEDLSRELLSFIFDFALEDSLELRKVCDDWDFVVTKHCNTIPIRNLGTFVELVNIFYRSKLKVIGSFFHEYISHIHTFIIRNASVGDTSKLGNVHTLILKCTGIIDVSQFGNVHTLDLTETWVKDVSELGNVHTLRLPYTRVNDVSRLGNVYYIDLSGTYINDVSALCNLNTLNISYTSVKDVSALRNVHTLILYRIRTDTSMLKNVIIIG